MKNQSFRFAALALILLALVLAHLVPIFAAREVQLSMGYNIVFIVDTSGSLKSTDPFRLREQGLGMVLSWLPGTLSKVGMVTFNTKAAVYGERLRMVQSFADVDAFLRAAQQPANGYTNITQALEIALGFFKEENGMDPELPNLIMMFSDGVLELPNKKDEPAAEQRLMELAGQAKREGIQISTIALNASGDSNTEQLRRLSEITGESLYIEVRGSEQLRAAFAAMHAAKFYSDKFELKAGKNSFGVSEKLVNTLNFTFIPDSPSDDFELVTPDGSRAYTKADANLLDGLYIIHITNPADGRWYCNIKGGASAKVANPKSMNPGAWEYFVSLWKYQETGLLLSFAFSLPLDVAVALFTNKIETLDGKKKRGVLLATFAAPVIFLAIYFIFSVNIFRPGVAVTYFDNTFA